MGSPLGGVSSRLTSGSLGGAPLSRCSQLYSRAPRLGEPNGDGLLRRSRTVLPFANVVHLLAHELACLRRRRFPFPRIFMRPFDRFAVRHDSLPSWSWAHLRRRPCPASPHGRKTRAPQAR